MLLLFCVSSCLSGIYLVSVHSESKMKEAKHELDVGGGESSAYSLERLLRFTLPKFRRNLVTNADNGIQRFLLSLT